MLGAFLSSKTAAVFAASGVILAAGYMLWMVKRVFFGPLENEKNQALTDLTCLEWGYLLPMVILAFWMGIYPGSFLRPMDASVKQWIERVETRSQACRELTRRDAVALAADVEAPRVVAE